MDQGGLEAGTVKRLNAVLGLAVAFLCIPWSAFVLTKLWAWFVVPLHVQAVSLWHAAGVILVARYIVVPENMAKQESDEPWKMIAVAVIVPAMVLGIGALYHRWAQ